MASSITKPDVEVSNARAGVPDWPQHSVQDAVEELPQKPTPLDALQALLAFSALHDQIRRRRSLAAHLAAFDSKTPVPQFEPEEQFLLDEVLQLVAERAVSITGADGMAIALAENNEIVLRVAAGTIRPDVGQRIDRASSFSGACFRTAQVFNCDDTETDPRVNTQACRKLGARSMVAVPLCGRRRVIGILEAFSSWPFGFNDSDVNNLTLLAELILAALKPEEEDRFAQSADAAVKKLETPKPGAAASTHSETQLNAAVVAESTQPASTTTAPSVPASEAVQAATVSQPIKTATTQDLRSTLDQVAPNASVRASAASAIIDKPIPPAPETSVLAQLTPANSATASTTEQPIAEDQLALPELSLGRTGSELVSRRQWIIVLLICIVVAAAFASGVWWKLRTAQSRRQMGQNQPAISTAATPAGQSSNGSPSGSVPSIKAEPSIAEDAGSAPQEVAKFPRVTGVRHWSSADSSTVVLDLEDQVQYEPGHLTNPDRFYFDLRDTQLGPELDGKTLDGDALLSRIRIAQPAPGMTRLVLEAKPGATLSRPQVSLERDPYRLVIEVSKAGAAPKGAVNLFPNAAEPEKRQAEIVIPPPTKEDLQWRARVPKMRIVVDAGHGGWDLGTVGRRGLLEKDLVLEISQRLGKLLESRLGSEVIYTRPDDNYIPLDDRAQMANQSQADLFISVHANYSDLPSARGVETYYTNFFSAPGSKDPNLKDVDTSSLAGSLKNSVTLNSAEMRDRVDQSRRLAASVQRSLYGTLSLQNPGLRDRGIKEAAFVVLTESAMPGILAEVSFVSSPMDEQKLQSDGYREKIAEALYRGIARYASNSRGLKLASARSDAR